MILGPGSAAQIPIQAGQYIRQFGALVPFEVSPPLFPLLIAGLGLLGVSGETAYLAVSVFAYLAGCVAVSGLVTALRPSSGGTMGAAVYALAPSRVSALAFGSDGSLLLCWSLIPCLLWAVVGWQRTGRAGRSMAIAALLLAIALSHPPALTAGDALALLEVATAVWVGLRSGGAVPRAVLASLLLAAGGLGLFGAPDQEMPAELIAGLGPSDQRRLLGPLQLEQKLNPIVDQAAALISSAGRREESLLWLHAMAIEYVISDQREKFDGVLECEQQAEGWCAYRLPEPNPATAVLVSRSRHETLQPIRGIYDSEGLEQYIAWAGRPEAAGLLWTDSDSLELQADLGPFDMLLVRRNCGAGWRAYLTEGEEARELDIGCDPIGFMTMDPGRAGLVQIEIEFSPSWKQRLAAAGPPVSALAGGDFPRILEAGISDALSSEPPPIRPGALVSVYGRRFIPERTRVLFGSIPGEVLWTGPRQVNVRAPSGLEPGQIQVVVEADGRTSYPQPIEVRP